jgi:hypothetical protein
MMGLIALFLLRIERTMMMRKSKIATTIVKATIDTNILTDMSGFVKK